MCSVVYVAYRAYRVCVANKQPGNQATKQPSNGAGKETQQSNSSLVQFNSFQSGWNGSHNRTVCVSFLRLCFGKKNGRTWMGVPSFYGEEILLTHSHMKARLEFLCCCCRWKCLKEGEIMAFVKTSELLTVNWIDTPSKLCFFFLPLFLGASIF